MSSVLRQAIEPIPSQQAFSERHLNPRLNGAISVVRILVADDSAAICRCLRGLLDQHNNWWVCDEASNGKEAVERFVEARPDLIVVDFQKPELNGLDAARYIVSLSPKTPIMMMTVHLSMQLSEEA